jgi:DNA invertase Pin-like site-specific DNA recombinase
MKGTISEMEVASFRERGQAALQQKAQRGTLVQRVAVGYLRGADDKIEKDPDARIQSIIDLVFRKFAELAACARFISGSTASRSNCLLFWVRKTLAKKAGSLPAIMRSSAS